MPELNNNDSAFVRDDELYNKKTQSIPKPEINIGVDLDNILITQATAKEYVSSLNIGAIESFDQVARTRDQIYQLYDTMAEDSRISAILRTYATDATQANDQGKVVWAESSDPKVLKFITYLLDTINVDKYIYRWAFSLVKYGDIYIRLYRQSDVQEDLFAYKRKRELNESIEDKKKLDESVNFVAYHDSDLYTHYVEMVANPANMFELMKFGKSYAYIQTKISSTGQPMQEGMFHQFFRQYNFRSGDIDIFQPTEFVHGCLEDTSGRVEEKVDIFMDSDADSESAKFSYSVRRGQSALHDTFKIWRQLSLLEASVLLNRVSKSATTRVVQPDVQDMPKDKVRQYMLSLKQMFEQKAAIADSKMMSEYVNAGPIENTVYIPKRGEAGLISTMDLSSNPDPGSLSDLDYFKNKLYASLNAVPQFFGDTDDLSGFSGGESLALISSNYGKALKKLQNVLRQVITDVLNLMCINKGLKDYVNKFEIKMQEPMTKEETDRREAANNQIRLVQDTMGLVSDIEDNVIKLKMLKALLANSINNNEVIDLLQEQIDALEKIPDEEQTDINFESSGGGSFSGGSNRDMNDDIGGGPALDTETDTFEPTTPETNISNDLSGDETILPNPSSLDMDFTDNA